MAEINSIVIVGRLTRDAELKYTQAGAAIATGSIAWNRRKKTGETWADEVNYFDFSMYGKSAESVHRYLTKGKQIGIQGELRQSRWEQDGQAHSKIGIAVQNLQLFGGNTQATPGQPVPQESYSADEVYTDDIPF